MSQYSVLKRVEYAKDKKKKEKSGRKQKHDTYIKYPLNGKERRRRRILNVFFSITYIYNPFQLEMMVLIVLDSHQ